MVLSHLREGPVMPLHVMTPKVILPYLKSFANVGDDGSTSVFGGSKS